MKKTEALKALAAGSEIINRLGDFHSLIGLPEKMDLEKEYAADK